MGDLDENTPPIHILLPTCDEMNTDVFYEILKSVVLHSRLLDNVYVNAMISGMEGDTFQVDKDDLSANWKLLTSNSRQIRQSKLLGYWAVRHYPLIGKKLIGPAWQPPEECNVRVSESFEITDQGIDNIVSQKMKLRIIDITVCKGTSKKLNYFVRAPMNVGRLDGTVLSSKMRAFDIEQEYLPECWAALKLGGFPSAFEQRMDSTAVCGVLQTSIVASHLTIDTHQKARRTGDQSAIVKTSALDSLPLSSCNVKLTKIKPNSVPPAKRIRIPNSNETNIDVLRVEFCKMREDIQNLTKSIEQNATEKESINGSERFHLAVFKQKDSEIVKLTESLQTLEKVNELLKDEKTKLNGEIEAKSNLIGALQNVVDVNSKLHGKVEQESNAMEQKLCAANQLNSELTDTNQKLRDELDVAKNLSANMESNYQGLLQKSIAADEVNNKLTDLNRKLQEDLNVASHHFADVQSNMQHEIQDLLHKLSAANQTNIQLTETNGKLQQEVNLMVDNVASMESTSQHQIQDLLHKLSAANQTNIQLTETNGKLQQEVNLMVVNVASVKSSSQHQAQDLLQKLSTATQTNIELADAKEKLEQELDAAKIQLSKNEELAQTLNKLKARTDILIDEFRARLEEAEKMNVHLSAENEKLHGELNVLKQIPCEENVGNDQIDHVSNEGHSIEPHGKLHIDKECEKLSAEPVKSGGCKSNEPDNDWKTEFISDDPIVEKCRPVLQLQKFGWMKFQSFKSTKFCPAFVYPVDEDGLERAQKIKADGYITDRKSPFFEFHSACELSDNQKLNSEVSALKKFNQRFGATFK